MNPARCYFDIFAVGIYTYMKTRLLSLPNLITIFRIVAAPVLWFLIYQDNKAAFTWLLTLAFFTDMIDGVIARSLHQESKIGSILDSIGDSLTIITGLAGVARFHYQLFNEYKVIIIIVLSLHFIQLCLSLWRYGKPSSFHTWAAKVAALGIGLFILITLHFKFYEPLFYLAVILLILDAIEESILVFLLPKWVNDVKGIYWVLKNKKIRKS